MARYLSDEWFGEVAGSGSDPSPVDLVIEHRVTGVPGGAGTAVTAGGPDGEVRYHVRLGEHGFAVVAGPADRFQVRFTEDYAVAAAVAQGRLAAASALLAGDMQVAGDLAALLTHRDRLRGQDLLPAAVRATTEF